METKGIKQDLINRLQAYLEEHGEFFVEAKSDVSEGINFFLIVLFI